MNLNKGYTKMLGTDDPATIDDTNGTQIDEIVVDMTTIETDVTANETATGLNTTHKSSDGKDHSDVGLNNAHRSSDGKNHSDVVLNNTHRTGSGADHADVASNTSSRHTQNTDTNLGTVGTKATPIDADKVIQRDSADSDNLVTSTWTQVKAFLKTYFDTLYGSLSDVASNTTHRGLTNNPHTVDIDDVTPTTTKGDIIVENGSNAVRVPVGTNTQVLSANSSKASGVEWVSAGTPASHASSHEDGGADEIDLGGLTGTNTALTTPTLATPTLELKDGTETADGQMAFDRTNEDLSIGDGAASQIVHMGDWKAWTPTWTNLTIGNGTQSALYTKIGKTIIFRLELTFGSTTSISGSIRFTNPCNFATHSGSGFYQIGTAIYEDTAGGVENLGFPVYFSATEIILRYTSVSASKLIKASISSTAPFTWVTGDSIYVYGFYECA